MLSLIFGHLGFIFIICLLLCNPHPSPNNKNKIFIA
ncbi:hypothetical protein GLYMA_10G073750v4 [Glycine max]|nr:hypothetical protein GLYMA_10G073750v4 [Glycine max]KAH1137203.1 hypothetical protein GYH30_027258 [Glycine max]